MQLCLLCSYNSFEYNPCLHQAQLEESQRQVEQDVSEMVNKTRGHAVDRIMKLKKRYGCAKDEQQLAVTLSEVRR